MFASGDMRLEDIAIMITITIIIPIINIIGTILSQEVTSLKSTLLVPSLPNHLNISIWQNSIDSLTIIETTYEIHVYMDYVY